MLTATILVASAFGQLRVCTHATRCLTLAYSVIGLPFVVCILADLGGRLCYVLVVTYSWVSRLANRLVSAIRQRYNEYQRKRQPFIPLTDTTWKFIDDSEMTSLVIDKDTLRANGYLVQFQDPIAESCDYDPRNYTRNHRRASNNSADHSLSDISSIDQEGSETVSEKGFLIPEDATTQQPTQAAETTNFSEFTPDLPLSLCAVMIVLLILGVTIFIHEWEYIPMGYSLYYAMLFFILQDYTIRDLDNTVPTFILLLSGLSIISTVINAVIYNIQNTTKRIQAKLPEEIRKRKAALAAAGFPDAAVDADQVLKELLEKEGSFVTRKAMPAATMEKLEAVCEATVQKVETEIKEEAEAEQKRKESVHRAMQPPKIDSSVNTVTNPTLDKYTETNIVELVDTSSQHLAEYMENYTSTYSSIDDKSTQVEGLILSIDSASQWIAEIRNADTNTDIQVKFDQLVQAVATMLTNSTNTDPPPSTATVSTEAFSDFAHKYTQAGHQTVELGMEAKPEQADQSVGADSMDIRRAMRPVPAEPSPGGSHLTRETKTNDLNSVRASKKASTLLKSKFR